MKKLLDYDPISRVSTYFHSGDGKFSFSYEQDPQAIFDMNAEMRADTSRWTRQVKNDWVHIGCVPTIVEYEWLYKYGVNINNPAHKHKVLELLNHPDYRHCKVTDKIHLISAHD